MNYKDKMIEIDKMIKNKQYIVAKKELENIIAMEEFKVPKDEQATHFSFYNYIEAAIYFNKYRPQKKNINPNNNIAEVYFSLGYIEYENKNYEKAIEYLDEGLEWNPVSIQIMSEKINVYRGMEDWEKYRVEIEKAYEYIYEVPLMAKYYRDLGFYYTEKGLYDVSNALYSYSRYFVDDELASNELMYIAQQEHREPRISTMEEIELLFKKYNIPQGISNNIVQIIYGEYQNLLKNNPDLPVTKYLARVLYDITKDKQFMLYVPTHDNITGINLMMPENWKVLDKNKYNELGVSSNTTFLFLNEYNQLISIVCDGKCSKDELDAAYKKNVETMKKQGIEIIEEFSIEGQKNIKQVFVDSCKNDMKVRILQNYLVLNGYLFNISWEVVNNVNPNEILKNISNGLEMELVWSLNGTDDDSNNNAVMNEINQRLSYWMSRGKTMTEAMEIVFGDSSILREISNEFKQNGVNSKAINLLNQLAEQTIEEYKQDRFWSDQARLVFKFFVLVNLIENLEVKMPDFVDMTRDVNVFKEIMIRNIENLKQYIKLSDINELVKILDSDKPLKSVVELIHNGVLPYERTELQEQGRQDMLNNSPKEIDIKNEDDSIIRFVVPNNFQEIRHDEYKDTSIPGELDDLFKPEYMRTVFELFTDKKYELKIIIEKIKKDKTLDKIIESELKYAGEVLENSNNRFVCELTTRHEEDNGYIRKYMIVKKKTLYRFKAVDNYVVIIKNTFAIEEKIINALEEIDAIIDNIFEKIQYIPSNKPETNNEVNKPIKIKCPSCNVDFELKWNVPSTEKVFYCKCPNCNAEIKHKNPNYKEI